MSPRGIPNAKKEAAVEKVEVLSAPEDVFPDLTENQALGEPVDDVDLDLGPQVDEEFNEHIKSLVALFVNEQVQELQQRIVDLETVVVEGKAVEFLPSPTIDPDEPIPYALTEDIPNYSPAHQESGGVPWFHSD